MDLSGRKALVVGLGKSGIAAARLLTAKGARVSIADQKSESELADQLAQLPDLHARHLGGIVSAAFDDIELAVLSPGVPTKTQAIVDARARGVEIVGEVELASRFIDEPLAGITGTNGKSTTTALAGHLLTTAGKRVFTGGNLGNALSNRVLEGGARDVCVVELSSYQLESIVGLRCAAATVLNVTPDHLERHPTMDAYVAAKARIFENQRAGDVAVLNAGDARVRTIATPSGCVRQLFDPRGDSKVDGIVAKRTGARLIDVSGHTYSLTARTLRGDHNIENALAALLLARHFDADPVALQRGLDSYPGLPHRLEPVEILDGVEWINDSKATNVDSVEKSLSAFPEGSRAVILILGGKGKGTPYAPLRELMRTRVKSILTIGQDAPRIAEELGDLAPLTACGDLATACARAQTIAKNGDVVLLSPACASFDQFKSFEDRGDTFKRLVRGMR